MKMPLGSASRLKPPSAAAWNTPPEHQEARRRVFVCRDDPKPRSGTRGGSNRL